MICDYFFCVKVCLESTLCPQAGLHFVANDWSILGHDLVPRMYGLLNEGGMVYSQAHAAVLTHMLPLKTEESTFVVHLG